MNARHAVFAAERRVFDLALDSQAKGPDPHIPVTRILAIPEEVGDAAQPATAAPAPIGEMRRKHKRHRAYKLLRRRAVEPAGAGILSHQIAALLKEPAADMPEGIMVVQDANDLCQ